jgi:hypothetical protein
MSVDHSHAIHQMDQIFERIRVQLDQRFQQLVRQYKSHVQTNRHGRTSSLSHNRTLKSHFVIQSLVFVQMFHQ